MNSMRVEASLILGKVTLMMHRLAGGKCGPIILLMN